jgi:hypothetical protein
LTRYFIEKVERALNISNYIPKNHFLDWQSLMVKMSARTLHDGPT